MGPGKGHLTRVCLQNNIYTEQITTNLGQTQRNGLASYLYTQALSHNATQNNGDSKTRITGGGWGQKGKGVRHYTCILILFGSSDFLRARCLTFLMILRVYRGSRHKGRPARHSAMMCMGIQNRLYDMELEETYHLLRFMTKPFLLE